MNHQPIAFCRECGSARTWQRTGAELQPVATDSLDLERACSCGDKAVDYSDRISHCQVGDSDVTWDRAIETLTASIKQARKKGHNRVGIYLPETVFNCGCLLYTSPSPRD